MAQQKLYQYLYGEDQGKIVSLVGIEAEENMTFLKFDDGSRCNVEFAAKLNDSHAYTDGKMVAEVCDRKNIWTFDRKELKDDVRYGTLKDGGQVVQGWDPYMHGRAGNENKAKVSITAIPPQHTVTIAEMKSGSEKLKELGITPDTPGYEEGLKNLTIPTQSSLQSKMMQQVIMNEEGGNYENVELGKVFDDRGNEIGETTMRLDPTGAMAPSAKDLKQYLRATEIYIPESLNEPDVQETTTNTQPSPIKESSTAPTISVSDKLSKTVNNILDKREEVMNPKKVDDYSDSPIYSIVSKCKKKDVQAPLVLDLKLPGKSIYNLIKEDFPENVDDFFDIILSEIDINEIKESLKNSLRMSYEGVPNQTAE